MHRGQKQFVELQPACGEVPAHLWNRKDEFVHTGEGEAPPEPSPPRVTAHGAKLSRVAASPVEKTESCE